jgi:hypothetical protein
VTNPLVSLTRLNLALEVANRAERVFVLLVTSDLPHPFFQLIALRNQTIEHRVSEYLSGAREARRIAASDSLIGEVLLLGYCQSDDFDAIRTQGRAFIGVESQVNLKLKIRRKLPTDTPRFEFRHSPLSGLQIGALYGLNGFDDLETLASEFQKLRGTDSWM